MSSSFRQHGAFCINEHSTRASSLFSLPEVTTSRNYSSSPPPCVQELQDLISRQDEFFMGPLPSSSSSSFGRESLSLRQKVIGMGLTSQQQQNMQQQQQPSQQQDWENHQHPQQYSRSFLSSSTANSNLTNNTILQQVMNSSTTCHSGHCNSENHLPTDYCYRSQSAASSSYHPFGYNFWTPTRFHKDPSNSFNSGSSNSKILTNNSSVNINRNLLSYSPVTLNGQFSSNINSTSTTTTTTTNNNNFHQPSFRPYSNISNSHSQFNLHNNNNNNSSEGYFSRSPSSPASGGSCGGGSGNVNNSSGGSCRRSANQNGDSGEYLCVFCKSNNEPESIYRSHPLRLNNIVVCPSLRNYTCCICKSTGDNAHTIKYCPYNKRGFYATRSHEKCNTNNNSKYKMKVHVVESMDTNQNDSNSGNINSNTNGSSKSGSSSASSTFSQQQDKDTHFHRRHFRPIPLTPSYNMSSESEDDASLFNSPTATPMKSSSSSSSMRLPSRGSLNHQLVFFNRTMQKRRS